MRSTDIAFCPRLKVKEDIPSFEDRLFANIAILQGRLMCMKNRMIPAAEVAKVLNMILEVEEVNVDEERKALSSDC